MSYSNLLQLDVWLFHFINSLPHNWFLNNFALFIHFGTRGGLIYLPVFLFLLNKKYRTWVWLMFCSGVLTFIVTDLILKPLIHRQRPFEILTNVIFIAPATATAAFPSGQTAVAAALVTMCILFFKNWQKHLLWLWLILVALDRIYMGHHYPFDVLAGAVVGIVVALFVWFVAKKYKIINNIS